MHETSLKNDAMSFNNAYYAQEDAVCVIGGLIDEMIVSKIMMGPWAGSWNVQVLKRSLINEKKVA